MPTTLKSPLKTVSKAVIPGRVRRDVKLRRARRALSGVGTIPCDAAPLLSAREIDFGAIWTAADGRDAWAKVARRLEKLAEMAPSAVRSGANRGVNPGDGRAIFHLIRALRPHRVLEIGTNVGFSTLHVAAALDPGAGITTVDIVDVNDAAEQPWKDSGGPFYAPRDLMRAAGVGDKVRFVKSPSIAFLEATTERYDFVFLDGSHDAAVVYREIPLALSALAPGGAILLHDYAPALRRLLSNGVMIPGPCLAVERLRAEGAGLVALPLGGLPWPTKPGSNVTSLALLARDD